MSFISFTMFRAATNMFRQDIREIDARMARRDHATDEEVQEFVRQSEREMNRRMTRRWIVILAVIVPIFPIFGTKLIFPWGGILGTISRRRLRYNGVDLRRSIYFSDRA